MQDEEWTRETVDYIRANSGLSLTQIYKWGWDQKKKVLKNPNGKPVASIDEFGGYSKFDTNYEAKKITKLLDIDWNEKIRQLDLECEMEEKNNLKNTEPKILSENKKEDIIDKTCGEDKLIDEKEINNVEQTNSFCTPLKAKPKRERYSSDITNVTISARNLIKKAEDKGFNMYVTPFVEDEFEKDYSFENYNFDNFDNFGSGSFIMSNDRCNIFHKSYSMEPENMHSDKFFWDNSL